MLCFSPFFFLLLIASLVFSQKKEKDTKCADIALFLCFYTLLCYILYLFFEKLKWSDGSAISSHKYLVPSKNRALVLLFWSIQ